MNNLNPKKSLGQNWLNSESALETIIETSDLKKDDVVLEVGPGKGALTEKILEKGARVIAIEKDHRLIEFLGEKFAKEIKNSKLQIIEEDVLSLEIEKLVKENYKIIANIPYYITGNFLRKFLSSTCKPISMTLLVQKEVAQRIVAKSGKESLLSLSVKAYGVPSYIKTVKRGSFIPAPKVDSAILSIEKISNDFFRDINEEKFFTLLKTAFNQKRKQLKTTLKLSEEIFDKCNLNQKIRPEELHLKDWRCVYKSL